MNEIEQLIEFEDFPQLEHVLHRLYGATRYVGTPSLQNRIEALNSSFLPYAKNAVKPMMHLFKKWHKRLDEMKAIIAQVDLAKTAHFKSAQSLNLG